MSRFFRLFVFLLLPAFMGCPPNKDKEERTLFPILIVTDTDLTIGNPDRKLPDELVAILNPLNLDQCRVDNVSRFWKANAQLLRLELKKQEKIQISPNYHTGLIPYQDSVNYIQAVKAFELTDDIFNEHPETDSDYTVRNMAAVLRDERDALKISYRSTIPANIKAVVSDDVAKLKTAIVHYLCSASSTKRIVIFYKVSDASGIQKDSTGITDSLPRTCPDRGSYINRDTIINRTKYRLIHNGQCGYEVGKIVSPSPQLRFDDSNGRLYIQSVPGGGTDFTWEISADREFSGAVWFLPKANRKGERGSVFGNIQQDIDLLYKLPARISDFYFRCRITGGGQDMRTGVYGPLQVVCVFDGYNNEMSCRLKKL